MPSERRLHPASLLFDLVKHLRAFALPALLVWFGASRSSGGPDGMFGGLPAGWETWLLIPLVPAVIASAVRYLTFRLRYDSHEVVIRSGLLFRNERHVPFAKIQNLDAVQNAVHRLLGVVEIRMQTGGGREDEARLSVLPIAAFEDMRQRVFEGRVGEPLTPAAGETAQPDIRDAPVTLLHLPVRELLLCGFLENKGMILIGAAYGIAWESGVLGGGFWGRLFGERTHRVVTGFLEGRGLPLATVGIAIAGLAVLLLVIRVVSMAWAFIRLYDFRLSRVREDLRTEFGLFTRVAATIPIRRVQTVTISQGPLHRWLARASVRVETAGGTGAGPGGRRDREWLAPLIRVQALPGLVNQIVPGFDWPPAAWQPVHPRAFRRAVKPGLVVAVVGGLLWGAMFGRSVLVVLPLLTVWMVLAARQHVRHLGWTEHDEGVLMRSGWLWRQVTLARANKIQSVGLHESPFDRRATMARVRVDTAGAGAASHRVDIPFLDRSVAVRLAERLASQAASTEFKW